MNAIESICNKQRFDQAYRQLKSKLSKGVKLGKTSRFIHKQAQKHRKPNGFFCMSYSYLWQATSGNCYFRRKWLIND